MSVKQDAFSLLKALLCTFSNPLHVLQYYTELLISVRFIENYIRNYALHIHIYSQDLGLFHKIHSTLIYPFHITQHLRLFPFDGTFYFIISVNQHEHFLFSFFSLAGKFIRKIYSLWIYINRDSTTNYCK